MVTASICTIGDEILIGQIVDTNSSMIAKALNAIGVKVVRIGMSIRFGGKFERLSERLLSSAFNHYYVRDSISLNYCREAEICKF